MNIEENILFGIDFTKIRQFFCNHKWIQPEIYERYDVLYNIGLSEKKYVVCRKCKKEDFKKPYKIENYKKINKDAKTY